MQFSSDQQQALDLLQTPGNYFLTGKAGTGKSTVTRAFLKTQSPKTTAILASTGAAAVLVGGRTFHSFFALGILEGGVQKTVERALRQPRLVQRLREARVVVIDEISMLSGETLAAAEQIARLARANDSPWGGLKVIAVGDFAQLPPVTRDRTQPDWAFRHEVWARSQFFPLCLETVHRTASSYWNDVLNRVREGQCDPVVRAALNERLTKNHSQPEELTRLFGRRQEAEDYNRFRLDAIEAEPAIYPTQFKGEAQDQIRKNCPIPEELVLKTGALVMLRRNDTDGLYVNGSLARVLGLTKSQVTIELVESGFVVEIEPVKFEWLNADGEVTATAKNFPLTLAWGTTIHKSQGATLDAARMNLKGLWESGQAYVALSRVRHPDKLYLDSWDEKSIRVDSDVQEFHASLGTSIEN